MKKFGMLFINMPFFLKFVRIALVIGGLLLLVLPVSLFPLFYAPRFMGVGALFFVILISLPPLLFRSTSQKNKESVLILQTTLAITLLLCALGELGLWQLYQYGFEYDKLIHFIMPLALTFAFINLFQKRYEFRWWTAALSAGIFIFFCGVLWEYAEFYNDKIFGTQLFGIYGADVYRDTALDLLYNFLGVLGAVLYSGFRIKARK